MLEVTKELQAEAAEYKRRVAGTFVLVDGRNIPAKISGKEFCVTRKIDGVMAYAAFRGGEAALVGTGGRDLSAGPCAEAFAKALQAAGIGSAKFAGELYALPEKGRPRVADALSALADPKKREGLRLALFDVIEIDGVPFKGTLYKERHAKLASLFKGDAVRPVEMRTAGSEQEVEEIYGEWVEGEGAEGLVVHSEQPMVWKVKPRHSIDAAVVGFTTGEGGIRDLMFAVRHEDGAYQPFATTGNGLDEETRASLLARLSADAAESSFVRTDSRGVAYQMVKPTIVFEVTVGDLVSENAVGQPKWNPLLEFDGTAWRPCGRTQGVSSISPVVGRERGDKTPEPADIRVSQLSDLCPFSGRQAAAELPKSTLLRRKVYKKTSKDKVMLQKFVAWKTNKEADPRYPAYVFHYTDYSSGRKDPLKKDIRVAPTEERINAFFDAFVAENVKKGWEEV